MHRSWRVCAAAALAGVLLSGCGDDAPAGPGAPSSGAGGDGAAGSGAAGGGAPGCPAFDALTVDGDPRPGATVELRLSRRARRPATRWPSR
ncbi:MAG: hypothetical protein WKG00_32725 [Polyangiaceae bacterium]